MIIMDLEWNRSYDKIPLEEILQIGAVRLERMGGPIVDTFSVFIRPCVHKKLNRTAKALPELQRALNSKVRFPAALQAFSDWCGEETVFADWGGDDFEVLRRPDDFGRHLVAADNERIDIGHGGQQLGLVGIFFKQGQFIARVLDDPADAVDSLLGKRLFGRN